MKTIIISLLIASVCLVANPAHGQKPGYYYSYEFEDFLMNYTTHPEQSANKRSFAL